MTHDERRAEDHETMRRKFWCAAFVESMKIKSDIFGEVTCEKIADGALILFDKKFPEPIKDPRGEQ